MSVNVEQLLADATRLSGRLREHDSSADSLMTSAQDVLKEVEAMRRRLRGSIVVDPFGVEFVFVGMCGEGFVGLGRGVCGGVRVPPRWEEIERLDFVRRFRSG